MLERAPKSIFLHRHSPRHPPPSPPPGAQLLSRYLPSKRFQTWDWCEGNLLLILALIFVNFYQNSFSEQILLLISPSPFTPSSPSSPPSPLIHWQDLLLSLLIPLLFFFSPTFHSRKNCLRENTCLSLTLISPFSHFLLPSENLVEGSSFSSLSSYCSSSSSLYTS